VFHAPSLRSDEAGKGSDVLRYAPSVLDVDQGSPTGRQALIECLENEIKLGLALNDQQNGRVGGQAVGGQGSVEVLSRFELVSGRVRPWYGRSLVRLQLTSRDQFCVASSEDLDRDPLLRGELREAFECIAPPWGDEGD